MSAWRVGSHYRVHVYDGERPVATFLREQDAAAAVAAHNALEPFGARRVLAVVRPPEQAQAYAVLARGLADSYGEEVALAGIGDGLVAVLAPAEDPEGEAMVAGFVAGLAGRGQALS